MAHKFAELAFTDGVRALQVRHGSRRSYARLDAGDDVNDVLGPREADFIVARNSFYMATVGETGWPYVQHRGGPPGFVRVLDDRTLGFADFSGNRQYVSVGNLATDDRVSLFFMDYRNRARLKLLGRATIVERDDAGSLGRLDVPGYRARVERGLLVRVAAFDWNCPQHIPDLVDRSEVDAAVRPLERRIAELESRLAETANGRTLV